MEAVLEAALLVQLPAAAVAECRRLAGLHSTDSLPVGSGGLKPDMVPWSGLVSLTCRWLPTCVFPHNVSRIPISSHEDTHQ